MKHGITAYTKAGCRCDECKLAKRAVTRKYRESHKEAIAEGGRIWYRRNRERRCEKVRAYQERNSEAVYAYQENYRSDNRELIHERGRLYRRVVWDQKKAREKDCNDKSKQSAGRHRSHWTSAEDKLVLDPNLTSKEIAFMLGRTIHSVNNRRQRLRKLHQQGESA